MKAIIKSNYWMSNYGPHGEANGYVVIPEGHKLHGLSYEELNNKVDVHCGLTFAELITPERCKFFGLSEENLDAWMVGFDTAHYGDDQIKWPEIAVMAETNRLKQQLELL